MICPRRMFCVPSVFAGTVYVQMAVGVVPTVVGVLALDACRMRGKAVRWLPSIRSASRPEPVPSTPSRRERIEEMDSRTAST